MSISGARVAPPVGGGGLFGSGRKKPGVSGWLPVPPKVWETRLKSTPVPPYWLVYKTPKRPGAKNTRATTHLRLLVIEDVPVESDAG